MPHTPLDEALSSLLVCLENDWTVSHNTLMARVAAAQHEALVEARRGQILDAALRRWAVSGFDSTSMEDLAREAGLAKGTLYLYFPTKSALLDALIRRYSLLPDLTALLENARSVPPDRAIPLLVREAGRRLGERISIVRLVLQEIPLRPDNARFFMRRVVLPANQLLADYLQSWIDRGVLRPIDPFVAARALVGMLTAFVFTQQLLGGAEIRPLDDELVAATISDVFLDGVRARNRPK